MVCLDTQVVIWGVQGTARESQKPMIARARSYLEYLQKGNRQIMIPAPVLFEYLLGFDSSKQKQRQREIIEKHFFVPSLDVPSAALAAELLGNTENLKTLKKDHERRREQVKVDAQIVAIAITHGAAEIISHDPAFSKIAGGKILVKEIPVVEEQHELFEGDSSDSRED